MFAGLVIAHTGVDGADMYDAIMTKEKGVVRWEDYRYIVDGMVIFDSKAKSHANKIDLRINVAYFVTMRKGYKLIYEFHGYW